MKSWTSSKLGFWHGLGRTHDTEWAGVAGTSGGEKDGRGAQPTVSVLEQYSNRHLDERKDGEAFIGFF